MAAATSYIGTVVQISVFTPPTIDAAGFAGGAYTTVSKLTEWGELGDTTSDIPIELLSGRVEHLHGPKDGGEVPFTFVSDVDAGQAILIANSNLNITVSVKLTDPDGKISYYFGLVANVRDRARNPNNYKGMTGVFRVNSATIRV